MSSDRWPENWRWVTVNDIKSPTPRSIAIGPFGSRMKRDRYVASGVPVIRGSNISGTRALVGDFVFVTPETADELRSCNVFAGDLCFPHRGAIGQVAIVPENDVSRLVLSTSLMKLTCNPDIADPLFVFYYFRSPAGRRELLSRASTVGTPGIGEPLTSLRSIPLPLPPIAEQRRIAGVLGALDDKIQNNAHLARRLDALVQMMFVERFIGPLAAGEVSTVGERLVCVLGGTPSRARPEYWDGGTIPWINSGQANEFRVVRPSELITEAGLKSSATKLLPAGTTIIAITGATMGKVSRLEIDACTNQSLVGVLASETLPNEFIYYWIRESVAELLTRQTGAAQQHVNKGDIESLPLLIPKSDELAVFTTLAHPAQRLIAQLLIEVERLSAVRDALLPKLVAGSIRVPDSYDPGSVLDAVAEAPGVSAS